MYSHFSEAPSIFYSMYHPLGKMTQLKMHTMLAMRRGRHYMIKFEDQPDTLYEDRGYFV